MGLTLGEALRLIGRASTDVQDQVGKVIAFAGAGGKTTGIFALANEIQSRVIITSTTHLGVWQLGMADKHITVASIADLDLDAEHHVTLITGAIGDDQRTQPVTANVLSWLRITAGTHGWPLLIEADGARQKPLKAPGENEPSIPDFSTEVVVLAGLQGLGKPLAADFVHRPEIFSSISGLPLGATITAAALSSVLNDKLGGLKNIPRGVRRVMVLNQADTPGLQSEARGMAGRLLSQFDSVVITSLIENRVHVVHEPCAGIVLAAGGASRYGRTKQLLNWRGQPLVRVIARTALDSGLSPVVVVAGAFAADVENAVSDLPVVFVRNEGWEEGQASSIRAGLAECPPATGSAIFLLADQPQVTSQVIRALVESHAVKLAPIVAPLVLNERRGNPVLFDRTTFADLRALRGEKGGRELFSKHRVEYLPWHDNSLLMDIDTEEDYRRLLERDL